jgi:hypothetical protein
VDRRRTSRVDNWGDWHSRCVSDLAPVKVAAFFCLALFFWPLFVVIPASHRAGVGARRRADDAGPRAHRHERSRQRGAYRAHFVSDRVDQQSHQRDGVGNAELYSTIVWNARHHGLLLQDSSEGLGVVFFGYAVVTAQIF